MYLIKLYKHNRILFIFILGFAFCQLFINFKRGLTSYPFLHYGMYSGVFPNYETIDVWEVEVNGKKLDLKVFDPKNTDHIIEPVKIYNQLQSSNELYYSHINKFLKHLPITYDSTSFI